MHTRHASRHNGLGTAFTTSSPLPRLVILTLGVALILAPCCQGWRHLPTLPLWRSSSVIPRHATTESSSEFISASRPTNYQFIQYDGDAISKLAVREWWRVLARFRDVGLPILSWLTLVNFDEMMGQSGSEDRKRIHARKLREMLVSLGPVFIKIGQALSNRPDIVGPIYVRELEKLQDNVKPYPDHIAIQIVKEELGRPADEIFDFEGLPGPVASASLCQVYKARIRATGQLVAVKVQRPNIFRTAEADLAILRTGAGYLQKSRRLRSNLKAIVDEFGETLWEELDFIHEGENCKKFRAYYAAPVLEGVTAPRVVDELTTKRVLTMEWIEGTKLPWGDDAERLIGLGLECSTYQLLEKGFLHADPHAGNLLRTTNGDLAYLDHGMLTQITEEQRFALIKAVSFLYNKEFDKLAGSFVDLGFVSKDGDPSALEGFGPALRAAFTNASTSGGDNSLMDLNFAKLSANIQDVAYRFPVRIPPYWSLVIRTLAICEGTALSFNPRFKVIQAVYPFILKYLLKSSGTPALRLALQEILLVPVEEPPDRWGEDIYTRPGRTRYKIRWSRLERMLEASSRPVNDLLSPQATAATAAATSTAAVVVGVPPEGGGGGVGVGVGGGLISNQETLDLILAYILSDNGAFLREALIEDILGALDDANLVVLRGLSLLSGGLIPPPSAFPDKDRLAVVGSLLKNLRQMAAERGVSSLLPITTFPTTAAADAAATTAAATGSSRRPSAIQAQALADLSRQVLAVYTERQATRALRGVFHRVEKMLHSPSNLNSASRRRQQREKEKQQQQQRQLLQQQLGGERGRVAVSSGMLVSGKRQL